PRWAGMWLFPNAEVARAETPEAAAQRALLDASGLHGKASGIVCVVRHTVTRFRITLDAYRTIELSGTAQAHGVAELSWKTPSQLSDLAMPAAHRRIATRLLDP
ncbi:MAG TPA: NUDIX domain-containing protein, partial [Polyangiaceae bacterium]